ncbi:MAG: peptidylprolyl isomerase [Planctomycetota bacterium]
MTLRALHTMLSILVILGMVACQPSDSPPDTSKKDEAKTETKEKTPAEPEKPDSPSAEDKTPPVEEEPADEDGGEPDAIKVQHILIGFKDAVGFRGSAPEGASSRTQAEAKTLANDLLNLARSGQDFDALVEKYTDDSPPGIYPMTNHGAPSKPGYRPRSGLVPAFGDVGFGLNVGEIGMSDYDPKTSPYGWHIIKRIE